MAVDSVDRSSIMVNGSVKNGTTTLSADTSPSAPATANPRTITELIDIKASQAPDEPIFGYPRAGTQYEEYTYNQLKTFSQNAAEIYSHHLPIRQSSQDSRKVIALLGSSTLDYLITAIALSRLGFTVLFLSTRLSEVAYLSLLDVTEVCAIVTDATYQKNAAALIAARPKIQPATIVPFEEYKSRSVNRSQSLPVLDAELETSNQCWIIHSSGSTGLPKPIYQTHFAALRNYATNMNLRGFITLPLYHAHGLSCTFRAISSGKKIYMYSAKIPLTRQNLLNVITQHDFEIFYGVPYALKLLSESEDGIRALAAMKMVMFGGSACPDALGDTLAERRVNLISHYGTTETGQLMTSSRPPGDKAWNYVRVHDKLRPYIRWEERGANLYELVVLPGWPSKVATNRDDGSYATKDLFEPHPTITDAWKYSARLDDTIILMNGEKAVPIALEQAVRALPQVREGIVFGSGRSRLGMLVVPMSLGDHVIEAIWPTVGNENKKSPAYAQVSREMIGMLPHDTALPQTEKGTTIRQAFYQKFKHEIQEIYDRVERSTGGELFLDESETRSFLRNEVYQLLPKEDVHDLEDDTDLFSLGVDSLQSTRLRDSILRQIQLNQHPLTQNVVFEHPSIALLASEIIRIRDSGESKVTVITQHMEHLVTKYSNFPTPAPVESSSTKSCVVVTGVTGSLGAHVVAQLAVRDGIGSIVCLVRAKSDAAATERVVHSLRDREIHGSLPLHARQKITCYASDLSLPTLGLSPQTYATLRTETISIIHCAWSVNFNKTLPSFEYSCILGAYNLITLCLATKRPAPASFNFCSSVSTVVNTPGPTVPEAIPDFLSAQGMGYAQSKLVTEHIVARAALQTGLRARVLRIGQITADTAHGIWNPTEAIPLMLRSAITPGIRALPTLDENPRWLPVDVVATAVIDISLSSSRKTVFNVVNPNTFSWTRELLPLLRDAGLEFESVGQREWVRRLRESDGDPGRNPTVKLVEFFARKYDHDEGNKGRKGLEYETGNARSVAGILGQQKGLSRDLVGKFVTKFLEGSWSTKV